MEKILIFDISKLLDKTTGTRENYSFGGHVTLEGLQMKHAVKGGVEIMRIEEGFNVRITNFETKVELPCDKCLKLYGQPIKIKSTERIFYLDNPSKIDDPNDLFLVDKKRLTVDISEVLRQEIILHFPSNLVCSNGCEGLCGICGKDKNKVKCKCEEASTAYRPLAKLKELLK